MYASVNCFIYDCVTKEEEGGGGAYITPTPNIQKSAIFFFLGICSFRRASSGRTKIMISVAILTAALAYAMLEMLRQCGLLTFWSHMARIGRHCQIAIGRRIRNDIVNTPMEI